MTSHCSAPVYVWEREDTARFTGASESEICPPKKPQTNNDVGLLLYLVCTPAYTAVSTKTQQNQLLRQLFTRTTQTKNKQ